MPIKQGIRIPHFYGFRIYLSSTILYYWLVLPFLLILTIKHAPELREKSGFNFHRTNIEHTDSLKNTFDTLNKVIQGITGDSLFLDTLLQNNAEITNSLDSLSNVNIDIGPLQIKSNSDKPPEKESPQDENKLNNAFNFLFNLLLISFLLGFIFNLPFKRYFSRLRKNKSISPGLFKFCKRFLLKSPLINVGILSISYIIAHGYMRYILVFDNSFDTEFEKNLYVNLFYISLIASVLSLLFVYFWEKHRVHIKYIEHIFGKEELRKRIFNLKVGRIRNRMIVSAIMTTFLPLTIVFLYLFLSITNLKDLNITEFTEEHNKILFGDYMMLRDLFTNSTDSFKVYDWLFYINSVNSFFMFVGIYSSIFIAFIYILFFVKWTTQDIVHPIKELLKNMKETGQGKMNNFGIVRTNDELGELTEGYNEMTQKLDEHITNISRMTDAYSRFVPSQFLDFLGKESYVDIKLGDQVQKEMTVLFSDIRSFTQISEQMTPKENFDFINYYLGYMEPVIRNNNGFIDKYIGDSIMALFSENAENAINAAIEMRIKLSQFNQVMDQFGKPAINSGIGIHTGSLMLGIVGGEGRMEGTVISDAVNLASRLEGLTKFYGCSIIISQDALINLNNPTQYNYRFLDIVKVKGKSEAVYIFEIIDGDPEDIKQLKLKTKEDFAQGINCYKSRKFEEALNFFKKVCTINNHDKTARIYVSRCENFVEHGVPKDWDGIGKITWD